MAQAADGTRLITVYDRASQSSFVTKKPTLRQAFADANIQLSSYDTVEPGLDEKLVASNYQVNIYRARPVTVVDGATRQKIITPYQSAKRIADSAGIILYPEDKTDLRLSSDLVGDGAGLQLVITRAKLVTVDLFGTVSQVRTQAKTASEFITEKDLKLTDSDRLSISNNATITAGMSFRIWREGKQTVSAEEVLPFATEQIKDVDQTVGYQAVKTAGVNGKKSVTYEVEIQNGHEVGRVQIAEVITEPAVNQVVVIGTKPANLPYTGGGTKTEWLAASNIASENWGYADFMVQKESGWNPNSVNRVSGACGLAQALPCNKVPGNPYNPVDSLNWMNTYVGRYGGWQGAYSFWLINHWY